jgi:hypothetical protein
MRSTWLVAQYDYMISFERVSESRDRLLCEFFFLRWSSSSTGNPRLVPSVVRKNSILKVRGCEGACPSQARPPKVAPGGYHVCNYYAWHRGSKMSGVHRCRIDDVRNVRKKTCFSESSGVVQADMTLQTLGGQIDRDRLGELW